MTFGELFPAFSRFSEALMIAALNDVKEEVAFAPLNLYILFLMVHELMDRNLIKGYFTQSLTQGEVGSKPWDKTRQLLDQILAIPSNYSDAELFYEGVAWSSKIINQSKINGLRDDFHFNVKEMDFLTRERTIVSELMALIQYTLEESKTTDYTTVNKHTSLIVAQGCGMSLPLNSTALRGFYRRDRAGGFYYFRAPMTGALDILAIGANSTQPGKLLAQKLRLILERASNLISGKRQKITLSGLDIESSTPLNYLAKMFDRKKFTGVPSFPWEGLIPGYFRDHFRPRKPRVFLSDLRHETKVKGTESRIAVSGLTSGWTTTQSDDSSKAAKLEYKGGRNLRHVDWQLNIVWDTRWKLPHFIIIRKCRDDECEWPNKP